MTERAGATAGGWGAGMRLLLLGLGLITLIVVGALVYSWLGGAAVPPPAPLTGEGGDGVTARQALEPAVELAVQRYEDVRLAAVSAHWSAVGKRLGGETEWTFQFFSPSTRRLILVAVADGTARVVRESVSPYQVPTFSSDEWRVDSDRALQGWWNRGGGSMVARRPDVALAMQLRASSRGGDPVWTVVGSVPDTDVAFVVEINAADGTWVER